MLCTEYSCRSYGSCMAAGPTESKSRRSWASLSFYHSSAAYIASLCASGFGDAHNPHLSHTVDLFNKLVSPSEVISVDAITTSPIHQRVQSKKLEDHQFSLLLEASSPADKARLLSVSAPHAASWLLVTPSPGLDLHLDYNELQISIQW